MATEDDEDFMRLLRASSVGATMTPEADAAAFDANGMKQFRRELHGLHRLNDPAPAQLRRIAELTEIIHSDRAARKWWERAAAGGDEDAREHVKELRAEENQ